MKIRFIYLKISVLFGMVLVSCQEPIRDLYPETLVGGFTLLDSETTGIDFNNAIKESEKVNHLYYNQIYSGAGVAIGDINNDGLSDIFFCGNQVSDRLYLNKGNFQFENITKKSRAARNSGWSWGVTMADVNSDGYLDIYVSRNGESMVPEDRKNQLYINNQDLTFTESAMTYGLADAGFSSQAVFFDMDNDGDLDMYQVNQPPDARLFMRYINIPKEREKFYSDKLYKNEGGKYYDVSEKAGISRELTYGLSVSAADFNNDGWTDLYIANDYDGPDFLYYNNGDGTFKNVIHEKIKHISQFSMGTDTGDVNNDGFTDLITLDMAAADHYRSKTNMGSMSTAKFDSLVNAGNHYQYMTNTLQINRGGRSFSDVSSIAGIAKTDWSWAGLLVDLDNDGKRDIIISNGVKKDVRNNDFLVELKQRLESGSQEFYEMAKKAPSVPLANYAFKNMGDLKFQKVAKDWGFDSPGFSSGMAYGDLDNDGDLDLVIINMDAVAFVYKNNASGNFLKVALEGSENNKFGYGTKVIIHHNGNKQVAENTVSRGYLSSVEPGLFFGLGKDTHVDKVEVIWPDGKTNSFKDIGANIELTAKYAKAGKGVRSEKTPEPIVSNVPPAELGIRYSHKENDFNEYQREILLPHNVSQNGPFMAVSDVNGDNLDDLFIGGAVGQSGVLYFQSKEGNFVEAQSQPWAADKAAEDLQALFFDADNDGDFDLYVASGGSEYQRGDALLKDRLYLNDGSGSFTKSTALPNIFESSQCVKASDIDDDGDVDLFVGVRLISGKYGFPPTSYILINNKGKFTKASVDKAPGLKDIGMVTDAVFTDIDNDKDEDLIIVGEWMNIEILINNKGLFEKATEKYGLENSRGIWWSITASDLDNDGDDDYILGNLGLNNKFKASNEHPFKLYANDFDENGTNDVVLAKFYKDDYVPVRGRECTSQQMPYVAEKFKDYHTFASSKLVEILPENKVDDAVVYEIKSFESMILINDNGKLIRKTLPNELQISPIKSALVFDVNGDGHKDIITVGNHFGVEVETTRYDAGMGSILIGDGSNNFEWADLQESGFYVPLDSRDIKYLSSGNKTYILVANNNASISAFGLK
ncbi:VCBS repeat-containing protein [Aestuariivivens sediminis]|uniref:VCBS repeat-containing protein n=1 Tax=Aestuariivivens sediminis TaxID=2913557 RepID=UPI001F560B69|nr:VCBS repeat-containing protein [Aestuariivivens sediminis]